MNGDPPVSIAEISVTYVRASFRQMIYVLENIITHKLQWCLSVYIVLGHRKSIWCHKIYMYHQMIHLYIYQVSLFMHHNRCIHLWIHLQIFCCNPIYILQTIYMKIMWYAPIYILVNFTKSIVRGSDISRIRIDIYIALCLLMYHVIVTRHGVCCDVIIWHGNDRHIPHKTSQTQYQTCYVHIHLVVSPIQVI